MWEDSLAGELKGVILAGSSALIVSEVFFFVLLIFVAHLIF